MLVGENGHSYVRHYLIDFGSTLGSGTSGAESPRGGWEYTWEPSSMLKRMVTLGFWDKSWVSVRYPNYESIGRFEATHFEPQNWKPEYPNPAFSNATDEDSYWAAKAVMAFSDEEIRAIVKTGRLSDREAEQYLVQTLIARRDKIGRYWFNRLSSFDGFAIVGGELRFDHLASKYHFAPQPDCRLSWFTFDPRSGSRQPISQEDGLNKATYVLTRIESAEGKIDVFIRNHDQQSEIVGVYR
jgi:hypothetical protein